MGNARRRCRAEEAVVAPTRPTGYSAQLLSRRRLSSSSPSTTNSKSHYRSLALALHIYTLCHPRRNDRPCCYDDDDELFQLGARSAGSVPTMTTEQRDENVRQSSTASHGQRQPHTIRALQQATTPTSDRLRQPPSRDDLHTPSMACADSSPFLGIYQPLLLASPMSAGAGPRHRSPVDVDNELGSGSGSTSSRVTVYLPFDHRPRNAVRAIRHETEGQRTAGRVSYTGLGTASTSSLGLGGLALSSSRRPRPYTAAAAATVNDNGNIGRYVFGGAGITRVDPRAAFNAQVRPMYLSARSLRPSGPHHPHRAALSVHHFIEPGSASYPPSYKLQPGGPGYETVYGTTSVIPYLLSLTPANDLDASFTAIAAHETQIVTKLLRADTTRGLRRDRPIRSKEVVRVFDERGQIGIRYGHFYVYTLASLLPPPVDKDEGEVDTIIDVLKEILE
ncbi:hypothetical protein C8F01DRAFT_1253650 [Mycena amicta]|nr:hypothetical protein C8F01DRAFT_1253650 [Mycena amicta]